MGNIDVGSAAALVVAAIAATTDLARGRIPNGLTYPALLFGFLLAATPGAGLSLAEALPGFAAAFLPALALFAVRSIGGGDVKLLGALGMLLGYPVVLDMLFYTLVAGMALGVSVIVWHGRAIEALRGFGQLVVALVYPGMNKLVPIQDLRIPFGFAIAAGTGWAILVPHLRVSSMFVNAF